MDADHIDLVHEKTAHSMAIYPLHQWADYVAQPVWCFLGRYHQTPLCACIHANQPDVMDIYTGYDDDDRSVYSSSSNTMLLFDGSLFRAMLLPSETICLCEAISWCGYLLPSEVMNEEQNTILALTMTALGRTTTTNDDLTIDAVEWQTPTQWFTSYAKKEVADNNGILVRRGQEQKQGPHDEQGHMWFVWPMDVGVLLRKQQQNTDTVWYGGLRSSHYDDITLPTSTQDPPCSSASPLLPFTTTLPTQDIRSCTTRIRSDPVNSSSSSSSSYNTDFVVFHSLGRTGVSRTAFTSNYVMERSFIWKARQQQYITTEEWHQLIQYFYHFCQWNAYVFVLRT
jgi:hypothetical protein